MTYTGKQLQKVLLGIVVWVVLSTTFYFVVAITAFDWAIIAEASRRLLRGEEVYQLLNGYGYYYAPFLTMILSPFASLPDKIGAAAINALTIISIILLATRYKLGLFRTALMIASPPVFYCLLLGQVDVLVLLAVFLPKELWAIAAITKPQTTIGMGLTLLKRPRYWQKATFISIVVLVFSFLLFGNWLQGILLQNAQQNTAFAVNNVLAGMFPFQMIIGLGLVAVAFEKDDERIYIAASPFLFPYAATSSYVGTLMMAFSMLRGWQSLVIWGAWWGALAYRLLIG